MLFEEAIADLSNLQGRVLSSVSGSGSFTLRVFAAGVDSWELTDAAGRHRRRPVAEVRRLWELLQTGMPVHVDSALGGSGSSRNQPETLLANLPYIEWLRLDGKKHLVYVGRCTHEPGSIKQTDPVAAEELRERMRSYEALPGLVAVTVDVAACVAQMRSLGWRWEALSQGTYSVTDGDVSVLIVDRALVPEGLGPGWYPVFDLPSLGSVFELELGGIAFGAARYLDGWVMLRR